MKRLPVNFGNTLDEIDGEIQFNKKPTYSQIMKSYNNINDILDKNKCEPYDLNNILMNYKMNNKSSKIFSSV